MSTSFQRQPQINLSHNINLNSSLTLTLTQYGCDIKATQSCSKWTSLGYETFEIIVVVTLALNLAYWMGKRSCGKEGWRAKKKEAKKKFEAKKFEKLRQKFEKVKESSPTTDLNLNSVQTISDSIFQADTLIHRSSSSGI